jgi:hypothetical protein
MFTRITLYDIYIFEKFNLLIMFKKLEDLSKPTLLSKTGVKELK